MNAAQVLETVGYHGFVKSLFNRSGDISKDFTHAVLGIITELDEFANATDPLNALEEKGDLVFYLEALRQVLDEHSPIDVEMLDIYAKKILNRVTNDPPNLIDVQMEWADLAKRWIGYGKAPTMSTTELFAEASMLVFDVTRNVLGDPITSNINKLLKRYNGMTFSKERAIHRDKEAERQALQA